jgi:hypothetical protein
MDIVIQDTKAIMLESMNTLFVKWYGVTPLLMLTWFSDRLLLFITPVQVEGWAKLGITLLVGTIVILYTLRQKQRSERHDEEKHRQELAQAKMDRWIEQYNSALDKKIIKPEVTMSEFIQQIEKIEALIASTKTR